MVAFEHPHPHGALVPTAHLELPFFDDAHRAMANGLVDIAGGNLFFTLVFTMVTSLILGMGVPTTANYVITSGRATAANLAGIAFAFASVVFVLGGLLLLAP